MILVKRRKLPSVHLFAVGQHGNGNFNVSGSLLLKSGYWHALYANVKELTSRVLRGESRGWLCSIILHRPKPKVVHAVVTVIAPVHTVLVDRRPEHSIRQNVICVYDQFESRGQVAKLRLRRNGNSLCYAI